jgi:hypothetical protein
MVVGLADELIISLVSFLYFATNSSLNYDELIAKSLALNLMCDVGMAFALADTVEESFHKLKDCKLG